MRIVLCEVDEREGVYFRKQLRQHHLILSHQPLTPDTHSIPDAEVLSTFIYSNITATVLDKMPSLKLIITRSTGFDHIDALACATRGIQIQTLPKYGTTTVAEHTIALLLALSRNVVRGVDKTRHDDFSLDAINCFDLEGKTLGVVGTGAIGARVIEIARALRMRVLACDHHPQKVLAHKFDFTYTTYKRILQESDIITFHIPLTKETTHVFNMHALSQVKRGVWIINTARGALIDTQALVHGLEKKIIAGAALDVLEGEGDLKDIQQPMKEQHLHAHNWPLLRKNHNLLKRPNVLITPHIAFYSHESHQRILDMTISLIKLFSEKAKRKN